MIDRANETMLPLSKAARLVPGRSGKGVHTATVWRWVERGVRGVKLETVHIGGCRYTSEEALDRFIAACSGEVRTPSNSARRQAEIDAAERELEQAGVC